MKLLRPMPFLIVGLLAAALPAAAQQPPAPPQDDHKRLEALEKRVQELEEAAKDAGSPDAHWYDRLKILGFADVTALGIDRGRHNLDNPDETGFAVGQLDLFLTANLPARFSFTSEIVFEADSDNSLGVDVERMLISYRVSDALSISAGRYHTALGYWNQTYHHGRILFASLARPQFYEFEDNGGLLPVHGVGIQVAGLVEIPAATLEYTANVGNGRGREVDEIQMARDFNHSKAAGFNLGVRPDAVPGLIVGGAFSYDVIPEDPGVPGRGDPVTEYIIGAYGAYRNGPIEVLTEYFHMYHRAMHQGDAGQFSYDLYYIQAAYETGPWKPYYRFENVRGPKHSLDPYFGSEITFYATHLAGVGYRFSPLTVVKLEAGIKGSVDGLASGKYIGAQIAIGF